MNDQQQLDAPLIQGLGEGLTELMFIQRENGCCVIDGDTITAAID